VLTTAAVTGITSSSAISGGNITSDGETAITARGICWSTNTTPTTASEQTSSGTGSGSFSSVLIGLTANTTYYVRSYATNSVGTGYGDIISFTTSSIEDNFVSDIDGNVYHTVTIGTQTWLVEDLKTTRYRNGDSIEHISDNTTWGNTTNGAYCNYDNNPINVITYGRLYNWAAVNDSRNIAPQGYHVPTNTEWETLVNYLGGLDVAGGKIKEAGTSHWWAPNNGATNESGFTGLPGGYRNASGTYLALGGASLWWTSTTLNNYPMSANSWHLDYMFFWILNGGTDKKEGISVRCIKD